MPRRKLDIEQIQHDILELLKNNNPKLLTTNQVAKKVGIHNSTASCFLNELLGKNLVIKVRTDCAVFWQIKGVSNDS